MLPVSSTTFSLEEVAHSIRSEAIVILFGIAKRFKELIIKLQHSELSILQIEESDNGWFLMVNF